MSSSSPSTSPEPRTRQNYLIAGVRVVLWAAALLGALGLLAYASGRALTDRTLLTQFLYWAPSPVFLVPATIVLVLGVLGSLLHERLRRAKPDRAVRLALLIALTMAWAYYAFVELRVGVRTREMADDVPPGALRMLNWNAMAPDAWPNDKLLAPLIDRFHPDLVLFQAPYTNFHFTNLTKTLEPRYNLARRSIFCCASVLPIRELTLFSLRLTEADTGPVAPTQGPNITEPFPERPPPEEGERRFVERAYNAVARRFGMPPRHFRNDDPGHLLLIRLDASERLGRDLIIWYIDLPSDPITNRSEQARRIAQRLALFASKQNAAGESFLPAPDAIIGDFNTPRGSASLRTIVGDFSSAYDQAGAGLAATWPRTHPTLPIDHIFLGPSLRAIDFATYDPGKSDHKAIVADVEVGKSAKR